ncbi:hemin ABC transporter permease [Parapedobacter defluvii]|uniref:Hemin ABC transporter permease n=1 Tax=Parapedobacter defluvii TaxID=2045106 RepID=A0ABQ1ML23_9SPHI|nr:iron ABC transporter permease [Parapedobacter defluvii]GGC42343.1 hemin ABC transporter permease [Parapedobacter defluvii]
MKNYGLILVLLLLLLFGACVLSVCIGAVKISASELWSIIAHHSGLSTSGNFTRQQEAVLLNIRLPRVLLGAVVGGVLAIAGSALQGLFRNPLAEPGLIGISSGASLFAVMMIVLEHRYFSFMTAALGYHALAIAAFIGACITTFAVYRLAVGNGKADITTLLLAGIAINALAGSFTGLLTYMATDDQLRNITFWTLGSLGGASWQTLTGVLPFATVSLVVLPFFSKSLNALALGESQAGHMGINVTVLKRLIIVMATLGVGASVAISGMIGFVGLVIPHILRMAFSADHRLVVPGSALLGASVLVLADLVARTLFAPAELPIGILTAIIGAPVFIYIILIERRKRGGIY